MEPASTILCRTLRGNWTEMENDRKGIQPSPQPRDHNVHCTQWTGCDCRMEPPCVRLPHFRSKRLNLNELTKDEVASTGEEVYKAIGFIIALGYPFKFDPRWPQEMPSLQNLQLVSFGPEKNSKKVEFYF